MLNVTIDGIQLQVKEGSTILEAAAAAGIEIPFPQVVVHQAEIPTA